MAIGKYTNVRKKGSSADIASVIISLYFSDNINMYHGVNAIGEVSVEHRNQTFCVLMYIQRRKTKNIQIYLQHSFGQGITNKKVYTVFEEV